MTDNNPEAGPVSLESEGLASSGWEALERAAQREIAEGEAGLLVRSLLTIAVIVDGEDPKKFLAD